MTVHEECEQLAIEFGQVMENHSKARESGDWELMTRLGKRAIEIQHQLAVIRSGKIDGAIRALKLLRHAPGAEVLGQST